jgi:hypothetical protein
MNPDQSLPRELAQRTAGQQCTACTPHRAQLCRLPDKNLLCMRTCCTGGTGRQNETSHHYTSTSSSGCLECMSHPAGACMGRKLCRDRPCRTMHSQRSLQRMLALSMQGNYQQPSRRSQGGTRTGMTQTVRACLRRSGRRSDSARTLRQLLDHTDHGIRWTRTGPPSRPYKRCRSRRNHSRMSKSSCRNQKARLATSTQHQLGRLANHYKPSKCCR